MKIVSRMLGKVRRQLLPSQSDLEELKINQMKTHLVAMDAVPRSNNIHHYEYKCFSQWGDDGIIQYLIGSIDISETTFIEFGVEDFSESNCRFLMMNNNWSGFVIDGASHRLEQLFSKSWYWKYDLVAHHAFITKENINGLLKLSGFSTNLGLLSIDIDGMDYWIFEEITFRPSIFIVEYNSVFGSDRAITVPYDSGFVRTDGHYSNLYYGASLLALTNVAQNKGYSLVGCNSAGNNAYYVRDDLMKDAGLVGIGVKEGYVESKFREARDQSGKLSYVRGADRIDQIKGMPIVNIETGMTEMI